VRQASYVVNRMAQGLRLREARQVLVILPEISNPYFSEVLLGIEEVAGKTGFGVLIGASARDPEREDQLAQQLLTGVVDGVLLMNGRLPPRLADPALRHRLLAVAERIPGSGLPTVHIDDLAAAQAAVSHLVGLGHRRIAHIAGPIGNVVTAARHKGYVAALAQVGMAPDPALTRFGPFALDSGEMAMAALLALPTPPTAVFCTSDEMAIGAIRTIKAAGLTVPGDLSVVGFDDIVFARAYDPPLTTVRQPRHRIGCDAMRLLEDRLNGIEGPRRGLVLPFELIIRESSAPPKHHHGA
jgi:LacI family repressor for deo operon, udp, cdd, tsx, nupC, and nupG